MFRKTLIAPLLAASAMALAVSPAYAGKTDRAREAIAAAEAKIHTAEQMGAATTMPERNAEARAALARAKESFNSDNKSTSIDEAIHASALADANIGELQQRKNSEVANANADVTAAQQQAAMAQDQANKASARADVAQQQAARSAAEASAARVAAENQQVETTVTTQAAPTKAARTVTRKTTTTTSRAPAAPAVTTTTTTVKQAGN